MYPIMAKEIYVIHYFFPLFITAYMIKDTETFLSRHDTFAYRRGTFAHDVVFAFVDLKACDYGGPELALLYSLSQLVRCSLAITVTFRYIPVVLGLNSILCTLKFIFLFVQCISLRLSFESKPVRVRTYHLKKKERRVVLKLNPNRNHR